MGGFEEGYTYFAKNASAYAAATMSDSYVTNVNNEIDKLVKDLNSFEGFKTASKILKGDVAEFWHAGTFNINSALKDSNHRAFVDRSNARASIDVSTNFGDKYGLKYYSDGQASAKAQSVSVLNVPIYKGQIRIIPRDQLEEATKYLERIIRTQKP